MLLFTLNSDSGCRLFIGVSFFLYQGVRNSLGLFFKGVHRGDTAGGQGGDTESVLGGDTEGRELLGESSDGSSGLGVGSLICGGDQAQTSDRAGQFAFLAGGNI